MNKLKKIMCNHFKQAKHSFNLDESAYQLIFGLAPTAWDIVTDIKLGFDLESNGNLQESGLCFLIVSNPGIIILWDTVWRHIAPKRPGLVIGPSGVRALPLAAGPLLFYQKGGR